jgi:hypothetical protein
MQIYSFGTNYTLENFFPMKRGVLFPSKDGGNFYSHVYGNQFLCAKDYVTPIKPTNPITL